MTIGLLAGCSRNLDRILASRGMTSWAWIWEESGLAFAGSAISRYWSSPPNIRQGQRRLYIVDKLASRKETMTRQETNSENSENNV